MKSIYVMSIEHFSGKTATCLALGRQLINAGYKLGYLKPISLQPWRIGKQVVDEDAPFVKEVLNLSEPLEELSILVVSHDNIQNILTPGFEKKIHKKLQNRCKAANLQKDVYLVEGGSTLREGYFIGLPGPTFVKKFNCQILIIIRYHNILQLLDDAIAAQARLAKGLGGIIINRIPEKAVETIKNDVFPYLENKGIPIFGLLPEVHSLAALTVGEITNHLHAETLTSRSNENALVEHLTVGAMTADTALSRFRKQINKAVITGGDRTDIQLAALETSTTCLILTGNLHPSPLIIKQAEEFGVTILLVPYNTMETIDMIDSIFGKTRLRLPEKLQQFETLMNSNVDYSRLWSIFGISV